MYSSAGFTPQPPTIETARLRLRPHRKSDYAECCKLWSDPIVARHTTGRPQTPEEVWSRLLRYVGHWAVFGYGYWVIEDKSTGAFIGEIGFADYKREIDPPLDAPEAGWALATQASGLGYATEALQAIIAWGDAHLDHKRTVCIIKPENEPSVRVAKKCGYAEVSTALYKDVPVLVYERRRP
jgi:RimJ/RimL family protein N-acetyltransferase